MTLNASTQQTPVKRKGGHPFHPLAAEIERLWKGSGGVAGGKEIYDLLGAAVPLRTVQVHVERLNRDHPKPVTDEPRKVEWEPWVGVGAGDSESAAWLLRLNAVSRAVYRRALWTTETDWAIKLRAGLEGLDVFVQLFVVREYALRDRVAVRFGEPRADTADLDELLGFQPWRDAPGLWLRPWLFFYQMQEPGAAGSALFDWLVRSLLGVDREMGVDWRAIVRAAHSRADYDGRPWSLSTALFSHRGGLT